MTRMSDDDMRELYAEILMDEFIEKDELIWPLTISKPIMPPPHGRFRAIRKHDIHTGFDLYAQEGEPVLAMEDGKLVDVIDFTGPDAGSPWWLPTKAIMIEGLSGTILYGEIDPIPLYTIPPKLDPAQPGLTQNLPFSIVKGYPITKGQHIGNVARVLRNDKGLPLSMLHVERYTKPGPGRTVTCCELWTDPNITPEGLIDPWPIFKRFFPDIT